MNKKIKICFISRSSYPLFNPDCKMTFGGAEVDCYIISKNLAKDKNFDVSMIIGDFGQDSFESREGVTLIKSYGFKENKILQLLKLIARLVKVNADVYFQETASGGTGLISLFCKVFGKKFIYRTASDTDCDGTFVKKHKLEGILYRLGLKNADIVVTQNDSNQKQLKINFGIDSVVIRNGVSVPDLDFEKIIKDSILWVARSQKLKQPFLFLDIAKDFPNEKFIMICPKSNYDSVDMDLLSAKANEIKNLVFISFVPFKEIDKYYNQAKIFINTSIYEGFPNTFVQSAINAVPIVSLNVNPDGFLTKYDCGICSYGDMSKLIIELNKLISNKDYWEKKSQNAYKYAFDHLNIKNVIIDYKKIILKLFK